MTRLIRMIVPLSLCGVLTGAIVLACHRGDVPASPRPEPIAPSGQPMPTLGPGGEGDGMTDGGISHAPLPGAPHAALDLGRGAPVLLASQPAAPGPTGAPPPPGAPQPGAPQPGSPPSPGAPQPGSPSQPGLPPGGTSSPSTTDAGISDALTPPMPSTADAGIRIDSGMQPILQRDAGGAR